MAFIEIVALQQAQPEPPMVELPDPPPPIQDPRVARILTSMLRRLGEGAREESDPPRPAGYVSTRILRDRERPHRIIVVSEFETRDHYLAAVDRYAYAGEEGQAARLKLFAETFPGAAPDVGYYEDAL
jgi:hypothetical protein